MAKAVVSIVKGSDPDQLVKEATDLLGGIGLFVRHGATVLIKPNVTHPFKPETSVCTSTGMVAAVVRLCKSAGAGRVIVGEASASGMDTKATYEISGIGAAAWAAGADDVIDFKGKDTVWVNVPILNGIQIKEVDLPKIALEADVLISLPILKTHFATYMTASIKNMKGLLKDVDKRRFHRGVLSQAVADLMLARKPDLAIVDALRPQQGLGPTIGDVIEFGVVLAGADPLAVDATCARVMGFEPAEIEHLRLAAKHGVGVLEPEHIEVRGRSVQEVQRSFVPPPDNFTGYTEYKLFTENACSSCAGCLIAVLETLKRQGKYEQNVGMSIVVGPKDEFPTGCGTGKDLLVMGNCVAKYRREGLFAPGCPPQFTAVMSVIVNREELP